MRNRNRNRLWALPGMSGGGVPSLPTGATVHLEGNLGVTVDGVPEVTDWADQSGNANHFTRSSGALTWLTPDSDGNRWVRFPTTVGTVGSALTAGMGGPATNSILADTDGYVAMVVKAMALNSSYTLFGQPGGVAGARWFLAQANVNSLDAFNSASEIVATGLSNSATYLLELRRLPGTTLARRLQVRVNRGSWVNSDESNGSAISAEPFAIGRACDIGFMWVRNTMLDAAEEAAILANLKARFSALAGVS